ncbi:hypothetical protein MIN45_P1473 [Methylomarinovum tepidoasis]|uniref:Uncharacterized protein n=1 Tax=Methylomarinovum tepidoasis TaxID=2840183 RepID=A0AAU9CRT9_9GAMM|nr:hypothetical protein [Methylomarinovum sp. IN45]BCX89103.1 hypothetical protein MIN45_P1473 [Methylomarinovum sp. IN45]
MFELLVALTVLFVAYTLYIFISVAIKGCPHEEGPETAAPPPPQAPVSPEAPKPAAEAAPATAEPEPSDEEVAQLKQFKNPETGELAAVPTNYRFAKRWIKEALVKEGLLDRIYRNNELQDPETAARVKEALERFKRLRKYWA